MAVLAAALPILAFPSRTALAQKPSGKYSIKVKTKKSDSNTGHFPAGTTLYLKKHIYSSKETITIDSAVTNRKMAVFSGSSFALDTKVRQDSVFTAGEYSICTKNGVLFSFFFSETDGGSHSITFSYKASTVPPFHIWETGGRSGRFRKENNIFLQFQNYLMLKELSLNQNSPESLAAEYTVNTIFPGGGKQVLRRLLSQAENDAPGSLTETFLSLASDGIAANSQAQLPLLADPRLLYTSFARNHTDLFLDKFKFSSQNVRNMAIDYLVGNHYLNDSKMRAATATACFRRYASSVVMGCEGSAVYAAEKYILGNNDVPVKDRAEASYYVTVNKGTLIGAKVPELVLKDTAGISASTYDLMGSYSIIYFYSDNCIHCKVETPKLLDFIDNYKDNPLNVYTVFTGTDSVAWKKYVKDNFATMNPFVNWFHTADIGRNTNFAVDFGIVSTPKMFLLDQGLGIIGRGILTSTLKSILEQEEENNKKAWSYLGTIFGVPDVDTGNPASEIQTCKTLVDKIYKGASSSDESFSRLLRQTFTYLNFSTYAPHKEAAMYLGQKYIVGMEERWKDKVFVSAVKEALKEYNMNKVGEAAPNLMLHDISGSPAELLPPDGKYKVLFFYRPNCGICTETVKQVKQACKKLGSKVRFTGISAISDVGANRKFAAENSLDFQQLYDKDNSAGLSGMYYVESVPLILVISPANIITAKYQDGTLLEEELQKLLHAQTKNR